MLINNLEQEAVRWESQDLTIVHYHGISRQDAKAQLFLGRLTVPYGEKLPCLHPDMTLPSRVMCGCVCGFNVDLKPNLTYATKAEKCQQWVASIREDSKLWPYSIFTEYELHFFCVFARIRTWDVIMVASFGNFCHRSSEGKQDNNWIWNFIVNLCTPAVGMSHNYMSVSCA